MYFPFISFIRKLDTNLKKFINLQSFNEHGDNLIKVKYKFACIASIILILFMITHNELKQPANKEEFVITLKQRILDCIFDCVCKMAVDNIQCMKNSQGNYVTQGSRNSYLLQNKNLPQKEWHPL